MILSWKEKVRRVKERERERGGGEGKRKIDQEDRKRGNCVTL